MPRISIIIPCYYNEKNIPVTTQTLIASESLFPEGTEIEYVLIDDGSQDNTWGELLKFKEAYPDKVTVLKLSRNFGAINADLAGLEYATGDCNVILAADLQDPPELIPQMLEHWQKGIKLVIANRQDREEGLFKSFFANTTHHLIQKFGLPNLPKGGFDLVLFDREIKEKAQQMIVKNTSLQYLFVWFGYPYVTIPYVRRRREIGKSGWTFSKKLKLFIDSFVSYTFFPIRMISISGLILGGLALVYAIIILISKMMGGVPVDGWSSTMLVILCVGAFQMIAIGIIGEYVWRALDFARNQPNFIIDKAHPCNQNQNTKA
jgi:dolichol-phosphate mannosyltransferase